MLHQNSLVQYNLIILTEFVAIKNELSLEIKIWMFLK